METQAVIRIKVAPLMGEVKNVDVQPGSTVRETLGKAGISINEPQDILLNDEPVDLETILEENSVITIMPRVQAGL
jgi:molybdopterin converting factor small subunit